MVGGNTSVSVGPVDDSTADGNQDNSGEQTQITDPVAYFASDISPDIIQGKCIACHVNGGLAAATPLKYVSTSTSGHLDTNYQTISDYIESDSSNADLLLQKSIGASGHGGGAILSANSEEYAKWQAFLNKIRP
jgi:mono/diheme cytochrome c family protein